MVTFKKKTNNETETKEIAARLASMLNRGDVITLEGDLGAGKTTFTKGIAKGLGIKEIISSPTFTIIKEYMGGKLPLYHMDVYRLEGSDEDIGFDEYFYGDGITIVEWAHFIEDYLPKQLLTITFLYAKDGGRILSFKASGKHYEAIVEQLSRNL